jgi:hypothetical protein
LRRNGLSSSVKNVMASPDLPALPDRPVYNKRRDLESYCQDCVGMNAKYLSYLSCEYRQRPTLENRS